VQSFCIAYRFRLKFETKPKNHTECMHFVHLLHPAARLASLGDTARRSLA